MREKRAGIFLILLVLTLGSLLTITRDAVRDEALYLQDAAIMAQCLAEGRWFGDEPVGLHGFLFKLPAASIFLITGPNVTAATIITMLMAMLAVWICYLIFLHITASANWAAAGVLLLITSYHFLGTLPTFLREIPALLAVLIIIYGLVRQKGPWWMMMGLLLALDAKEMVYFMILPGLCAWIIWSGLREKETAAKIAFKISLCILPFIIIVIPMFFTGLIPLNPRLPYIMGLHKAGLLQALHWKFAAAGSAFTSLPGTWLSPATTEIDAITWFWSLLAQLFGPKGFSLVSIPKFIIVPAVAMGIRFQSLLIRSQLPHLTALPFIAGPYLLIIVITRSSGRHLLPIAPILILFFILFIRDGIRDARFFKHTLIAASAAVALELFFSHPQLVMSLIIQTIVLITLWAYYLSSRTFPNRNALIAVTLIAVIAITTAGSAIAASLLLPGQIGRSLSWGRLSEIPGIVKHIPNKKPVWINANPLLISFFTQKDYLPPNLDKQFYENFFHIPKSRRINRSHPQLIHSFHWKSPAGFARKLRRKNIESIIIVSSTSPNKKFRFPLQDLHPLLEADNNFTLQSTHDLKNKRVHIFTLTPSPTLYQD